MTENRSNIDFMYLKDLYASLAASYNEQSKILSSLNSNISAMNISISSLVKRSEEHDKRLDSHESRIRDVERKHDTCDASSQIRGVWHHIKRLNAFKDMISIKSQEDSQIIDLHAARMDYEAQKTKESNMIPYKGALVKMIPWFVVVFVFGISLASILMFQFFSGKEIMNINSAVVSPSGITDKK